MTAKKQAKTNETIVTRDKKFSDNGAWVVTFANGSSVKIFRDTEQFSFPVWYVLDNRGFPMDHPREFKKFDDLYPIVTTQANFDSVLVPPDHVSRSYNDTYYVSEDKVLRCGSPSSNTIATTFNA